jgi:hypothetical protein
MCPRRSGRLLDALHIFPRRVAEIADQTALTDALKHQLSERLDALRTNLQKVGWQLDDPATLRAVAGEQSIETVSILGPSARIRNSILFPRSISFLFCLFSSPTLWIKWSQPTPNSQRATCSLRRMLS